MAKLPSTLGQRAVPRPTRNITTYDAGIGARAQGRAAQELNAGAQDLARGVGDAAQAAYNAEERRADVSLAEAKTQFLKDQIAIEAGFDKDQDWQTYGKRYDDQVKKARAAAAQKIADPRRRKAFELDADVDVARGSASIASKARVKEVEGGRAGVFGQIDSNLEAAVKTQDPQARTRIVEATLASIKAAEKAGYLTPTEGLNHWNSFRSKYAEVYIKTLPDEEQLGLLLGSNNFPTTQPRIQQKPMLPIASEKAIDTAGGDDAALLKKIAQIESRGDPMAVNTASGASGLFQFMPGTAQQYGLKDPTDPRESTKAAKRLLDDNRTVLRGTLGREPTDGELYLAHQQGATGAAALLGNPDKNALVALTAVYGDDQRARAAIEQNGGNINMTAGQFASLWTQKFSGQPTMWDIAQGPPPGGYDFSKPTGTQVDFLSTEARLAMIESATRGVKDKQESARAAAQMNIALNFDDTKQSAFLNGNVAGTEKAKIMAAYPNAEGARMVAELDQAAQSGADNKIIAPQSVEADLALLDALEATAKTPGAGSAEAAARYGRLYDLIKQKHEALGKDPGGYVREVNPAVDDAWAAASGEGAGSFEAKAAVSITLAEQAKMGVPEYGRRALPNDVANTYVEQFTNVKPEEAADLVESMAKDFGPMWGGVLSDLTAAGLPSYAVVLGSLDRPDHAMFRTDLIEANKLGAEQINKLVPEATRKDVDTKLDDALADFNQTLAIQSGGPEMAVTYQDAIKSVALYSMIKGEYTDPQEAAQAAADAVIGSYQTFDTYRVPDTYDGEAVSGGLDQALARLSPEDIMPMDTEFGAGLSPEFLGEETVKALRTQGTWVTNEDETGVYLRAPNGNFVARPDGSLFEVQFLEAERKFVPLPVRFTRSPVAP
jgi:soluble lytic murein transglycosylase